ncbi:PHP14 phosphatase, partial [Chauna torquata]|nr:PHP14 phosphatase [Chauna torquata]
LSKQGYNCECLGAEGSFTSVEKMIHVHKFAMGFGRANHSVPTEKLRASYPDCEITWADEDY